MKRISLILCLLAFTVSTAVPAAAWDGLLKHCASTLKSECESISELELEKHDFDGLDLGEFVSRVESLSILSLCRFIEVSDKADASFIQAAPNAVRGPPSFVS